MDCEIGVLLISREKCFEPDVMVAEGSWDVDVPGLFGGHDD